jgi:hypothetical protein
MRTHCVLLPQRFLNSRWYFRFHNHTFRTNTLSDFPFCKYRLRLSPGAPGPGDLRNCNSHVRRGSPSAESRMTRWIHYTNIHSLSMVVTLFFCSSEIDRYLRDHDTTILKWPETTVYSILGGSDGCQQRTTDRHDIAIPLTKRSPIPPTGAGPRPVELSSSSTSAPAGPGRLEVRAGVGDGVLSGKSTAGPAIRRSIALSALR